MKKSMSVVMAMVFVAGLSLTAASAFAGGACCANKEKASADAGTKATIMKVSDGAACATKSSMANLLKAAPGTTMKYERVNGGIALVVTAASKEYVPVVQKAMMTRIDDMKMQAGATCAMSAGHVTKVSDGKTCPATASITKVSDGATCATKASAVKVSDGATCATKTSAVKVSDGATCATKASASASAHCADGAVKTSMASMECPEWMKVLCGANCTVTNTANGVTIQWTTTEKNMVEQVQVAGEKLHADLSL
ncbi:MAG: hypothetical protein SGI90_09985 [Candidatus Eisenbacteria bacterium]|nr:hypothetical protein [Candidatus Eisenbacteria bacterium]